jgi:hypothetical protein
MGRRCKNERHLVDYAKERGWKELHRNKTGHIVVLWPPNNKRIPLPSDPSRRGLLNAQTLLHRLERTC